MSREIKFRVWDIKSKRYRDSIPVVEQWWDSDCWDDSEQALEHPYVALDVGKQFAHRLIWEQYTGLKDRNDKEIYEGDILRWDIGDQHWDQVVEWENVTTGAQGHGERFETLRIGFAIDSYYTEGVDKAYVVGNIHKDGDLVK